MSQRLSFHSQAEEEEKEGTFQKTQAEQVYGLESQGLPCSRRGLAKAGRCTVQAPSRLTKLEEMIGGLGWVEFCDIRVEPFRVQLLNKKNKSRA
jgi:hypothetical protein